MSKKMFVLPGINIQWPWSDKILMGKKKVETRTYDIPEKYRGKEMVIIETPGPLGKKLANITSARMVGIVVFDKTYKYKDKKHWASEKILHCVEKTDKLFKFNPKKPKWAWKISYYKNFTKPLPAPKKRGIIFATSCRFPSDIITQS